MGGNNKDGMDILNIFRALNHVHIINFQNISDAEDDLIFYHADGVLWTHKILGDKGFVSGYSPKTLNKESIKKKIKEGDLRAGEKSDFTVMFPDFKEHHPEVWKEYDKKKKANLRQIRERYLNKDD